MIIIMLDKTKSTHSTKTIILTHCNTINMVIIVPAIVVYTVVIIHIIVLLLCEDSTLYTQTSIINAMITKSDNLHTPLL